MPGGGGVRDLDNVLFLELATPRKWVNSMVRLAVSINRNIVAMHV